mgnify:FL=1
MPALMEMGGAKNAKEYVNETSMSRWLTKRDENLITVMPECFYRASSVFCVRYGLKQKDSGFPLKDCGNDILNQRGIFR